MGRLQKREYKTTFPFPFSYDKNLTPPLTPAMKILAFLFNNKAIGGRVGKPVYFIDDDDTDPICVTEKNKNILIDALFSKPFLLSEQEKILNKSVGVSVGIPFNKKTQRNEGTILWRDNVNGKPSEMFYEAFHKILPIMENSNIRTICVDYSKEIPTASDIYNLWSNGIFDVNKDINYKNKLDLINYCKSIANKHHLKNDYCMIMLNLAYKYNMGLPIEERDNDLIINYFNYIHKIMYILSTPTLRLLDKEGPENNLVTFNFYEPNYNDLINKRNYYLEEVKKINKWLSLKLETSINSENGFKIYADYNKTYGHLPNAFIPREQFANKYEYILKKLLLLILYVYQFDLIKEYMSVGQRYISVCHYCGGLFFRKSPNNRFCNYYRKEDGETPCNNKGLYRRLR